MRAPRGSKEKQVQLTIFGNEPLARLAEQRLQQAGIPCMVRSLQGGAGLWGSAFNLPHGLYVFRTDEMRAREVLDLTPLEIVEREGAEVGAGHPLKLWLIMAVLAIVLVLIISAPSVAKLIQG